MSLDPITACKQAGFSEAFLLPNTAYEDWTRHRTDGAFHSNAAYLAADPVRSYPWANACLIAVWPYKPFDDDTVVCAYYLASNRAYHAINELLQLFRREGIRAERAETPYRTQLLSAGIGTRMDNQLWYYPPYGTYVHLQGVMLNLPEPIAYTAPHANAPVCDHCGRCGAACFGALCNGAFDWKNCIRSFLENDPLPERFLPELRCFSGCERCQNACPKNPADRVSVPSEVRAALDPVEIVKGNDRAALQLLGTNRKKQLLRQAIVLCANRNRTEALPYLWALFERTDKKYQPELAYAISLLQNGRNVIE